MSRTWRLVQFAAAAAVLVGLASAQPQRREVGRGSFDGPRKDQRHSIRREEDHFYVLQELPYFPVQA